MSEPPVTTMPDDELSGKPGQARQHDAERRRHDGSMVTFKATKGSGRNVETLIDLTVAAGSGDSTSGMTIVEGLPGGHDKDITLVTDIMSPVMRPFSGDNLPDGLLDDTR